MKAYAQRLSFLFIMMLVMSVSMPALSQEGGDREGGERGERQREDRGDRGERGDRGDRDERAALRERWENASEEEREEMREEMLERMQQRRAENAERQAEEMRERLGMSAEDYELIGPMIDKVRSALRDRETASRSGRGGPGQRGGGSFGVEQSDNSKAASEALAELRQAIEDDNSGDIKSALEKLRKARTALDLAVREAREELRSVCSAKWEAEFVVMGVLN